LSQFFLRYIILEMLFIGGSLFGPEQENRLRGS